MKINILIWIYNEKQLYFQNNNQFYTFSCTKNKFVKNEEFTTIFKNKPTISILKEDFYGNLWFEYQETLGVFIKNGNLYEDKSTLFIILQEI